MGAIRGIALAVATVALVIGLVVPTSAAAGTNAPDLSIALNSQWDFVGHGVISATGAGEQVDGTVQPGSGRYFAIVVANPGSTTQDFTLSGTVPAPGFTVAYSINEGEDITSQMTGGGYPLALRPGKTVYLYARFSAAAGLDTGASGSFSVEGVNAGDPTAVDMVTGSLTVPPLRVWAVNFQGTLRCTATFPTRTLTPGQPAGATFTLTNLTGHKAWGSYGYLVYRDAAGNKLWDTAPKFEGPMFGTELLPHQTRRIYSSNYDRVRWSGPLTVTPVCQGVKAQMPKVVMQVSVPNPPASIAAAIDTAVAVPDSIFQACHPGPSGEPATGTFDAPDGAPVPQMTLRCWADVRQENGFDVVSLQLVSPSDGPDYVLDENQMGPWPNFPQDQAAVVARWSFVVTADGARPYLAMMFSNAPGPTVPKVGSPQYDWHKGSWTRGGWSICGHEEGAWSLDGDWFPLDWANACPDGISPHETPTFQVPTSGSTSQQVGGSPQNWMTDRP